MTPALLEVLVDARARIIRAQEAAADGEVELALQILEALEIDVEHELRRHAGEPGRTRA